MIFMLFFGIIGYAMAQTVPSVVLNSYYGRWYQVYSDFTVMSTFEFDRVCSSAYYYPYPNGTIAVVNSANKHNSTGPFDIVKGWANVPNASAPGKLSVHLKATGGIPAPYWIYKLGPIVNHQYQYSIVSDDIKLTLFVLSRNITDFNKKYNKEVVDWLFANDFVEWYNRPILSNQTNCVYPEIYFT